MTAPAVKEGQFASAFSDVVDSAVSEFGNVDVSGDAPATPAEPVATEPASAPAEPPTAEPAAAPVDGQPAAEAPVDPLAGSEPFKYGAEGKVLDFAHRFPGEGLLIPEDKVGAFEALATERDQLNTILPQAYRQLSEFAALSRFEVPAQMSDDGRTVVTPASVLEGRDGLIALHVDLAREKAAGQIILDVLENNPASLLSVDEQGNVRLDPAAIENLQWKMKATLGETEGRVRSQLGASVQKALTPAPQPVDYSASAPSIVDQAIRGANLDGKGLTKEDHDEFRLVLPRFVRPTEPRDGQRHRQGAVIVDETFGTMVVNRARLRAQTATQATTAEKAGRVNATASQARQPQPTSPTSRPAPANPASASKPRSFGAQSADLVESALADLGLAH